MKFYGETIRFHLCAKKNIVFRLRIKPFLAAGPGLAKGQPRPANGLRHAMCRGLVYLSIKPNIIVI